MSSLLATYKKEALPQLKAVLKRENDLALPRIQKVVVNIGIGKLMQQYEGEKRKQLLAEMERDLARITGQKPALRGARISIAGFKLRQGSASGLLVTLRRKRMWDFLERFVKLALPRMRDFRGISPQAIDEHGNISIGISEQLIFPEIPSDEVHTIFSLEVTIVTNAGSKEAGEVLLRAVGFPLKR